MSTPYWKKASWNKSMSRLAKQERLAREKKEAEAKKPVKEEVEDMQEGLKPEHNMRPGWMLKADPQLGAKVDANKKKFKEFKKLVGSKPEKVAEETVVDEAVVPFTKKKADAPRDIEKHDVENAWALKHVAAKDDKISYQHNGVTIHHANGDHTFILGGHKPLFDKDEKGKLKFKDDIGPARRAFKMPTQKASKGNVVSLKKEEVEYLDEARINGREYASQGVMHPDHAKMDIHQKTGRDIDFYASGTGDKMQGKVTKNDGKHVHIQAHKDKEMGDGKLHKFKVTPHLPKPVNEEVEQVEEKMDMKKASMLDVIRDFKKSNAPQFKGKSVEKRREMAIAAKLSSEETEMSKETEQLDELKKSTLASYVKKAADDRADTGYHSGYWDRARGGDKPEYMSKDEKEDGQEKRKKGIDRAMHRLTKEDVEPTMSFKAFLEEGLTEGVWPGTPEYKAKFPDTTRGKVGTASKTAKGTQTVTSTGVKHERSYDDSEKDDAPETTEKRGRGRPKGSASGARQKGSAPKSKDGVDYTGYPLHLPGRH